MAEGTFTRRMPLLRVGKVRRGKSPPSNTAINRGDEPPRISHAMRYVKMNLIECTMSLMLVVDDARREDVSAVEQWVMMKKNPEAKDTSPIKLTRNPDPESQDPAPIPSTPSASSNVGGQFTPPSRPAQVSPDKFPGLARMSPDLHVLQRGQGMCNGVDLNMVHFQQVIKDCYTIPIARKREKRCNLRTAMVNTGCDWWSYLFKDLKRGD